MKNIAIFASGSGSNAENIIRFFADKPNFSILFVLCNNKDAYVHQRAKNLGIPSFTFSKEEFNNGTILKQLQQAHVDFVVLAGFLLKVPDALIEAFPRRIVNIHPALLPKFGGKGMYGHHVHEAVVAAHEVESGITIHYVDNHYDHGNIILQAHCAIKPTDSPDQVFDRVHVLELAYFPQAIEVAINALDD